MLLFSPSLDVPEMAAEERTSVMIFWTVALGRERSSLPAASC
jgi:hypothetical protein